ncbi:hypothetical protein [Cutibacterium granulosum]|uniref:hypothetical protein n=1 Tax=Cutibacterium granulosum TaxID=33011 RepID=UPI002B2353B3|nr:hypothetical protein [Cutibacterium granulosum]MEA5656585.1 hypothetical protein [Cutibacterium granulosum]
MVDQWPLGRRARRVRRVSAEVPRSWFEFDALAAEDRARVDREPVRADFRSVPPEG